MGIIISSHSISDKSMREIEDELHRPDGKPADHAKLMRLASESIDWQPGGRPVQIETSTIAERSDT